jgi:hypothetical protein
MWKPHSWWLNGLSTRATSRIVPEVGVQEWQRKQAFGSRSAAPKERHRLPSRRRPTLKKANRPRQKTLYFDAFAEAYLETAIWADRPEGCYADDVWPACTPQILEDCYRFQLENEELLDSAYEMMRQDGGDRRLLKRHSRRKDRECQRTRKLNQLGKPRQSNMPFKMHADACRRLLDALAEAIPLLEVRNGIFLERGQAYALLHSTEKTRGTHWQHQISQ